MADRKVYVELKVQLVIYADQGAEITEVLENMDYNFTSNSDNAEIEDTEITNWEIIDSK